ncbi:LPS translocon maturation chaperone LptM [Azonexus sp.]|uniref:LPS translocon maturation chaperone LptM n=1 Tax=Azonexus sp. TaxID=1872668 RepID=UPI0039E27CF7
MFRTLRLASLSLIFGLAACGMKGPLELPATTQTAQTRAPDTAPTSAMPGGDGSTPAPASSSANKGTQP